MRKMSWTGRMLPFPGASASTTQMGGPIPSRRGHWFAGSMIPTHQPCRRGDLVFQAKLSHRDGG